MIIEHVPRGQAPTMPPSNYERWKAVSELYRVLRPYESEPVKEAK